VYAPNYRIKVYVGRNLLATAVVIADDDKTEVIANTWGGEICRDAAADLGLLLAHSVLPDSVEREALKKILESRGHGGITKDEGPGRNFVAHQAPVEDDIPF
jgi:hypothetical protein